MPVAPTLPIGRTDADAVALADVEGGELGINRLPAATVIYAHDVAIFPVDAR